MPSVVRSVHLWVLVSGADGAVRGDLWRERSAAPPTPLLMDSDSVLSWHGDGR
jgi:hypothetical protein